MHKFIMVSVAAVSLALCAGCGANPAMRAQVDALQQETNRQNAEIQDLSARAARLSAGCTATTLASDTSDLASSAWSWLTSTGTEIKNSDTYQAMSDRVAACYNDGRANVHSMDDAKALMLRCYHNSN